MNGKKFVELIQRYRAPAESKTSFIRRCGKKPNQYYEWEDGKGIRDDTAIKVFAALGCDQSEIQSNMRLLMGEKPQVSPSEMLLDFLSDKISDSVTGKLDEWRSSGIESNEGRGNEIAFDFIEKLESELKEMASIVTSSVHGDFRVVPCRELF